MELVGAIISDHKSIRLCEIPLAGLTVLIGPNGAGKSNLIEAMAAHDPLARESLERRPQTQPSGSRVGLVVRFDAYQDGTGSDAETLRGMIVWPWAVGMDPDEITEDIGAYCGSTWWLYGGNLSDPSDQTSLTGILGIIRTSILAGVHPEHVHAAIEIVEALLQSPILVIQEDFAVELSCDRDTPEGKRLSDLAGQVSGQWGRNSFYDLLGVLTSWTGRWPPLIRLTRGPSSPGMQVPAGFDWVTNRLGGVAVVSSDVASLEAHLDSIIEQVHDRLMHRPHDPYEFDGMEDAFCERCLHPDHGGRVDPNTYQHNEGDDADLPFPYPGDSSWFQEREGWTRLRPTISSALSVVESEANRLLVSFVAEHGRIQLDVRPIADWRAGAARCRVRFTEHSHDDRRFRGERSHLAVPIGVRGYERPPMRRETLTIPLADTGQGFQRWIATAVRLAADQCASGRVSVVFRSDPEGTLPDDEEIVDIVHVEDPTPRILLIDEPEQHLHVRAQEQTAAWCLAQARQNCAVLVATHSPSFVALPPERSTTCMVVRREGETLVRTLPGVHGRAVVDRARELGYDIGLGREALAQLTRAVAIVEGAWDRELLYHFFTDQLAEQRVLVVALEGSDEVKGLADAAVIPALGVPAIALLDEVRATSAADLMSLPAPLTKAERGLRDLASAIGDSLKVVRYEDPDVICALPEAAVLRAFPSANFPGWDALLAQWRTQRDKEPAIPSFKAWATKSMGLSKKQRFPPAFFSAVLASTDQDDRPSPRLSAAVQQMLELVEDRW